MKYYVKSELGIRRFTKYRTLMDFIYIYTPKWLHKLRVYKDDGRNAYEGKFVKLKNGSVVVRF